MGVPGGAMSLRDGLGMHLLTLRFADDAESRYRAERDGQVLVPVRGASLLGAVCLVAAWPFSEQLFPSHQAPARLLLGFLLAVMLALVGFTFSRHFLRWLRPTLVAAYLSFAMYPLFLLVVIHDPGYAGIGSLAIVVLLIYLFTISPLGVVPATATGLALLGSWLVALVQPGMAPPGQAGVYTALLLSAFAGAWAAGYFLERAARRDFVQRCLLAAEREKSDRLLFELLPRPIATRMREGHSTIADSFPEVSVLFADLVGFTQLSERIPPATMVDLLNRLFSAFDALAAQHGLEKIKTMGDGYHIVAGLPLPRPDHVEAAAAMALGMREAVRHLAQHAGLPLQVRIGLHTGGPVVAGVIGRTKYVYDVWGDAVNTASRLESHGLPDHIHTSEAVYERLQASYLFEERGVIDVKSKGPMHTYFLLGRRTLPNLLTEGDAGLAMTAGTGA